MSKSGFMIPHDRAALYDIDKKKVIRISEETGYSIYDSFDYAFSRDGSLLWCCDSLFQVFALQIPSLQIRHLESYWFPVCRPRKGGLLFRNPQNSDALYLMESSGDFRKVFDFEKPLAERPCIEVDCEPDPFLCYTYEGSKDSFILDADWKMGPLLKYKSKLVPVK